MVGRLSLLVCAVMSVAGCAVTLPRLQRDVPAHWQHAPAAGEMTRPAPDLSSWWKAFHDDGLDRLVDTALAENLTVRQAVLRVDAARELAGSAHSHYLPELGAHTYSEPTPDSSASYFQMGFDAKWEIALFGRAKSAMRVAEANVGVADSDAQAARVSVVAEVARAYIELRAAQQRVSLLERVAANAQDKAALTATRVRLRLASASDLARAQVDQANADAALYEPQVAIDRSLQQLALLLGRVVPDAGWSAPAAVPELGELRIASAPADLLRTRPEIRRAENEVLKAAGELGLANADRLPRIGLGGSLTYASKVIGHSRLSDADSIVTFGPAIEIPLFDWGMRKAMAASRNIELSVSALAYRQAVLEGVAEAETALATLAHDRARVTALDRSLASLRKADRADATLHRLGLADSLDRAASSDALLQAQLEISQAQQSRSVAFIALYKALGGAPLPATEPAAVEGRHQEKVRAQLPGKEVGEAGSAGGSSDIVVGAKSGVPH